MVACVRCLFVTGGKAMFDGLPSSNRETVPTSKGVMGKVGSDLGMFRTCLDSLANILHRDYRALMPRLEISVVLS
jgi:hypothetical protein